MAYLRRRLSGSSWLAACAVAAILPSCDRSRPSPPGTSSASAATPAPGAASQRRAGAGPSPEASEAGTLARREPARVKLDDVELARHCGPLPCERFADAASAFSRLLEARPRVLALGEAHTSQAAGKLRSATVRFRRQLLPLLRGRASDLLLELWVADKNCPGTARRVQQRQQAVTRRQAVRTPSEFEALGQRARELGITPHLLDPDCKTYERILQSGPDDILTMLETIAEHTERQARQLLAKQSEPKAMLVAYGGALHNDLTPKPAMERLSFGPALAKAVEGRYLALDLIVPELILDHPPWNELIWFSHVERRAPKQVQLLRTGPGSYVLVFRHGVRAKGSEPTREHGERSKEAR